MEATRLLKLGHRHRHRRVGGIYCKQFAAGLALQYHTQWKGTAAERGLRLQHNTGPGLQAPASTAACREVDM